MRKLFQRNRPVSVSLPPVMSFGEFCEALDIFKEEVYASGEIAGIAACQAVPSLELWVRENWGMKDNTPIPFEIQQLYDEAVGDFNQQFGLSSVGNR